MDLDDDELKATRKLYGLDKDVEDDLKFIAIAYDICKERGKLYDFQCPICKERASAIKNDYNGHLWAKCETCNISIIE